MAKEKTALSAIGWAGSAADPNPALLFNVRTGTGFIGASGNDWTTNGTVTSKEFTQTSADVKGSVQYFRLDVNHDNTGQPIEAILWVQTEGNTIGAQVTDNSGKVLYTTGIDGAGKLSKLSLIRGSIHLT